MSLLFKTLIFIFPLIVFESSHAQISFEKGKCIFEGKLYKEALGEFKFVFNEGKGQSETEFKLKADDKVKTKLSKLDKQTILATLEFTEVFLKNGQTVIIQKATAVSGNPKTYITMKEISAACRN